MIRKGERGEERRYSYLEFIALGAVNVPPPISSISNKIQQLKNKTRGEKKKRKKINREYN